MIQRIPSADFFPDIGGLACIGADEDVATLQHIQEYDTRQLPNGSDSEQRTVNRFCHVKYKFYLCRQHVFCREVWIRLHYNIWTQ